MKIIEPLTDKRIRAAKTGKKLFDGGGLYIEIMQSGARIWRLKYSIDGKDRRITIGHYPEVSLKEARAKRAEIRRLIRDGVDPVAMRKEERERNAVIEAASKNTFRAVALEWLETQKDTWSSANLKKKSRLLEILFSQIGDRPITEIVPADILAAIQPYEACGKIVTAHAHAQTASQVGRYARACGYCVFNAGDGLTGVLKPIQSKHYPCLTDPQEVGELLRDIENYSGDISVMYALRLLP